MRAAGCGAVRVALSPDGATVWVTARANSNHFSGNRPGSLTAVSPAAQALRTMPSGVFS
jgi:hypothetical protein